MFFIVIIVHVFIFAFLPIVFVISVLLNSGVVVNIFLNTIVVVGIPRAPSFNLVSVHYSPLVRLQHRLTHRCFASLLELVIVSLHVLP